MLKLRLKNEAVSVELLQEQHEIKRHLKHLTKPFVMFTEEPHTHYSVRKMAHLQGLKTIGIKANANGEMDLNHLRETLMTLKQKKEYLNIVIVANFGSIYATAFDDVRGIR